MLEKKKGCCEKCKGRICWRKERVERKKGNKCNFFFEGWIQKKGIIVFLTAFLSNTCVEHKLCLNLKMKSNSNLVWKYLKKKLTVPSISFVNGLDTEQRRISFAKMSQLELVYCWVTFLELLTGASPESIDTCKKMLLTITVSDTIWLQFS